jgi:hypothetical protein
MPATPASLSSFSSAKRPERSRAFDQTTSRS